MKWHWFSLCGFLCTAVVSNALAADAPGTSPPRNVVMIVSDDQHWGDFGFMGHPVIRTPRLDKLAAQSAVFPNGYVPTSLCRASLATMLTGQYAHQHRICCNDPPEGVDREAMLPFMKNAPALPRLLHAQKGYLSLQTGKWWEGHYSNGGFTHGMSENRVRGRHGDKGLGIGRQTMQPMYDFIDTAGKEGKPFFVWYAPMMPHEPHTPPQRLLEKYQAEGRDIRLAKYFAMCEWFDETCGQLLDHLDQKKLSDKTLVVFVIDNGWITETGPTQRTRGKFAPKSKISPYDGGVRTPVMLRWPGKTKAGRYEDLVSTIDLAPTILSACGLQPTPGMQGSSLLDAAAGKGPLKRDAVFGDLYEHTAVDVENPSLNLTHRWVRQGEWKLIAPVKGEPELYNVRQDPHEEKNLAAGQKDRVEQLKRRLDEWWHGKA
jgi:uncharacterized sulfatase